MEFDKLIKEGESDRKLFHVISIKDLENLLKIASETYYNTGKSKLTDELFDYAKDVLEERDPNNPFLSQIGAPVTGPNKAKLPFPMFSLDKIKPTTGDLIKFSKAYAGPFVVSDKLDGASAMVVYERQKSGGYAVRLFRRGNGIIGADISHLKNHLLSKRLHAHPPVSSEFDLVAVRGEVIMSRKSFEQFKDKFKDARGLVNGIINRKQIDEKTLKHTEFVAYELVEPRIPKKQQLKCLADAGFKVAFWKPFSRLDEDVLMRLYEDRRKSSPYIIDGLVIEDNGPHDLSPDGNPDSAVAFKMRLTEQAATVKVLAVFWEVSKDGRLVPRVQYEPVDINGVILQFATGYNAKFIADHGIGIGSQITVIRSGDVVPTIIDVLQRVEPSMPNVDYHWNESGVDIFIENHDENDDVRKKRIVKFFAEMGVENISGGLVNKFWKSGYTTIAHYLRASKADFLKLDGVQDKLAIKLQENIQSHIKNVSMTRVMAASNCFGHGIGVRILDPVLLANPDVFLHPTRHSHETICNSIEGQEGIQRKTAEKIALGIPRFHTFMADHPEITLILPAQQKNHKLPLSGQIICITGFRDKQISETIEDLGGEVSSSVSKRTTLVVAKDLDSTSGKISQARDLSIKIMSKSDFEKYVSTI